MKYSCTYMRNRIRSIIKRRILKAPVSVIVPVYNSEKTIERCLDSLINQSHRKIKIICVNDGSTDKTFEILKHYGEKYHRVKIINQKN